MRACRCGVAGLGTVQGSEGGRSRQPDQFGEVIWRGHFLPETQLSLTHVQHMCTPAEGPGWVSHHAALRGLLAPSFTRPIRTEAACGLGSGQAWRSLSKLALVGGVCVHV